MNAFNSPVFGGSIFNPIKSSATGLGGMKERTKNGNGRIEKKNNLLHMINSQEVNSAKGGRFYVLKNIKTSEAKFLDIYILMEGKVQK